MKKFTIKTFFKNFEEIIASLLFCCTLGLVVINVICRYVLRTGIPWAEEFATGCFVWTAFIGAAACYKRRAHVGVDVVVNRLPRTLQNIVKQTVNVLLVILCGYMFYISCIYNMRSYNKPTALLGISSVTFSISLTLAFLDMTIWSIAFIFMDAKSIKKYGRVLSKEELDARKEEEEA